MLNRTDTASNVNRFEQSECKLDTIHLRTDSRAAGNIKLSEILKKGAVWVNQTVVLLMKCVQAKKNATEESGRNIYLFVAFFLTNSRASNPPFLKLRQALMRWTEMAASPVVLLRKPLLWLATKTRPA